MDLRDAITKMSDEALASLTEFGGELNPNPNAIDQAVAAYECLFRLTGVPLTQESTAGAQLACLNLAETARLALVEGNPVDGLVGVLVQALAGVYGFARAFSGSEGSSDVRELLDGLNFSEGT